MSPRISSAFACLLATAAPASGFAPPSTPLAQRSSTASQSQLQMSSAVHHTSEDMYPQLMSNAQICANSDTCSIEMAESYLREIVHIQSGCAAGTMSGNAVCGDVQSVSEVVADLREKIGEGAKREVRTFWDMRQDELENLAAATDGSAVGALTAPLKPAYLAIVALYAIGVISLLQPGTMDFNAGGVVPFTGQELWWSIRDGYVGDLTHHLFRNGGLVVSDPVASVGSSISPQELFWSIRDGYMGNTLFGSGGEGSVETVPFTPQEVWLAVKNGYSVDMAGHWFRNGGLSM